MNIICHWQWSDCPIKSKPINNIIESCVKCNLCVICYYRFSFSWFSNWHVTLSIKKRARVAKNECNQIFSMIYACRATPWGESILEEREGETTRATEMSEIKRGMGTVKGKERNAERKRERVEACITVSPGKSIALR